MRKLSHTIALIWIDDDPRSSQVQQVRELFSLHLSRAVLFALFINLAALAYLLRDTAASVKMLSPLRVYARLWNDGIYVLVRMLYPLNFSYAPG